MEVQANATKAVIDLVSSFMTSHSDHIYTVLLMIEI
jgi:hypothetical protein